MVSAIDYLKEVERSGGGIDEEVTESVREILGKVREDGDDALHALTERFDGVSREELRVSEREIRDAAEALSDDRREAIDETIANVRAFHEEQGEHVEGFEREFHSGVRLGQRIVPVDSAGTYVPGGRHPLVAAPAMSIVPAEVAGVPRIVTCAPPQEDGGVEPAQLYAMDEAGADEIYCVGGAQAIGAMAYGTESVPAVATVTGPGNVFTTEAKRQVYGHVGIDFLAGPSEVLILADDSADPELIATDLLAQAEHDPNARAILVATEREVAEASLESLHDRLPDLETEEVARESWAENGEVAVAPTMADAVSLANEYAIEHLQVMIEEPRSIVGELTNYGSLFLGEHSPVVFGDKAVGTNHSLPTGETARYSGGIWVGTYTKTLTHQEATAEGAREIAAHAARICEIEGTHAHRLSAEARMNGEPDA